MNLSSLLLNLLQTGPILLGVWAIKSVNEPRASRYRQVFLPIVAAIFAVLAMIVLYRLNGVFDSIIATIFHFLPFLERFYQASWLYVVENVVILLIFMLIKQIYLAISRRYLVGPDFRGSETVGAIYDFDVASSRWFVSPRLSQTRVLFAVVFWVSLALTWIYSSLTQMALAWPGFSAIAFPVVALIVIGEIYYALNGLTRVEATDLIVGDDDSSSRVVNYGALRDLFESRLQKKILDSGVDLAYPHLSSTRSVIDSMRQDSHSTARLHADYFDRLKREGVEVDENLIHATWDISAGKSIVLNTPFYQDLTPYISIALHIQLLHQGTCLFIVGRDSIAEDVRDWIRGSVESMVGVPGLWAVDVLGKEGSDDLNVGILRFSDLHNDRLIQENDDFLKKVSLVVLLEPARMLITGQIGLGVVFARCGQRKPPVCVSIDRNHDGLVDALSHLLKVNVTDVVATPRLTGVSSEMVWRTDGPPLVGELLPEVTRYLGMGTEIAALALKYHVSRVKWIGGDRFPVVDMSWIAGQYYLPINTFAELELSQRALTESFEAQSNPISGAQEDHSFLVVEDEINNVYETIRMFTTRSKKNGFVNVLSEDYVLRDYMVDNRRLFAADPKAIPSVVPDFVRTERNTVLRLIVEMCLFYVAESDVRRELEHIGIHVPTDAEEREAGLEEPAVVRILRAILCQFTGIEQIDVTSARLLKEVEPNGVLPQEEIHFKIVDSSEIEELVNSLQSAYFVVEDDREEENFIGACLQGHVEQTLLPGQFLTFAGKYYEVRSIGLSKRHHEVILRRAADHITGRPTYRSLRYFDVAASDDDNSWHSDGVRVRGGDIQVSMIRATVTAQSLGYLEMPGRAALDQSRKVMLEDPVPRVYHSKQVLEIRLDGASAQVRRTIALLLNELFVTMFPLGHHFVFAVTEDDEGSLGDLLPKMSARRTPARPGATVLDSNETQAEANVIYVVEDSMVDLGLVVAVQRNWNRLLDIVLDYLRWLVEEPVVKAEPAVAALPRFPGDTDDSYSERVEIVHEAERQGTYMPPPKPSRWERFKAWLASKFRRVKKVGPQAEEDPQEPEESESTDPTTTLPPPPPGPGDSSHPGVVTEPELDYLDRPEIEDPQESVAGTEESVPVPDVVVEKEDTQKPGGVPPMFDAAWLPAESGYDDNRSLDSSDKTSTNGGEHHVEK